MDLGFYSPGPLSLCLQKGGLGRQRLPALQKHLPSQAERPSPPLAFLRCAAGSHRLARRTVMDSRAFVRKEKRLRKIRPGNDPIFYHFKEAFVGFAESQKEDYQFNPITSFAWWCVAKIKIKPPLFNGQKAKTYNLPSRRRQ